MNLVNGVLSCIERLRIDVGHLEDSKLGQVVQWYSEDLANMPFVQPLAKRIIEKWSRLVFNIKSKYDCHGDFDDDYRLLQKRLQKIRKAHTTNSDELSEEDSDSIRHKPVVKPGSAGKGDILISQ